MNSTFNLEEALKSWRTQLKKQQGIESGYIEELESNLLDRFDDLRSQGLNEKLAFQQAVEKCFTEAEEVADEFYKARTPIIDKTPPWKGETRVMSLLPSYLKTAIRSFLRKKTYTAINYLGLTIGLLTVCFVGLYINYELSWDTFHSKSDRIYRVGQNFRSQEYSLSSFDGFYGAPREVQLAQVEGFKSVQGVEDVAHFWIFGGASYLTIGDRRYSQEGLLTTNTPYAFFNLFDWKFLYGSPQAFSAFTEKAVLTISTAVKINEGDQSSVGELIGRSISVDTTDYEIAGIIEDIPSNSHYDFEIALHDSKMQYWGGRTYALLDEKADINEVKRRWEERIARINPRLAAQTDLFKGFAVHNLEDIHLQANALYEAKAAGDERYLYIFAIIGGVILLITFTNYTNLSIAMYSGRNREIGMRKVMGAGRAQVAGQFLMEAILISLLAIPLVLFLVSALLPYFNQFMGVTIKNQFIESVTYLPGLILIAIVLGLISGAYPAFALSGKKIRNLFDKQISRPATRGFTLRKSLITFQFVLLIGLGSATWLINDQLEYISEKDIGYEKEGIMYVLMEDSAAHANFQQFLSSAPGVNEVGKGTPLARRTYNQTTYSIDGYDEVFDDGYNLSMNPAGLKAYGIKTTLDEYFEDPGNVPDRLMLINQSGAEKFARVLGIEKEELIGRVFRTEPEYTQENGTVGFPFQIDGFFEDINMFSLKEEIDPYFMQVSKNIWANWSIVNFNTENISRVMEEIETAYDKLGQPYPMISQFQEDRLRELYEQDQRVASLTIYLSVLAFMVALMGLIGLSAYLTSVRKKEIGVRKVLGASNTQLVFQLNKEYLYLIGIALVIAAPIAFFGISQWLSNFAYRIEISPFIFIFIALVTLVVSAVAVTSQTLRAATSNPVDSLRNEQ